MPLYRRCSCHSSQAALQPVTESCTLQDDHLVSGAAAPAGNLNGCCPCMKGQHPPGGDPTKYRGDGERGTASEDTEAEHQRAAEHSPWWPGLQRRRRGNNPATAPSRIRRDLLPTQRQDQAAAPLWPPTRSAADEADESDADATPTAAATPVIQSSTGRRTAAEAVATAATGRGSGCKKRRSKPSPQRLLRGP